MTRITFTSVSSSLRIRTKSRAVATRKEESLRRSSFATLRSVSNVDRDYLRISTPADDWDRTSSLRRWRKVRRYWRLSRRLRRESGFVRISVLFAYGIRTDCGRNSQDCYRRGPLRFSTGTRFQVIFFSYVIRALYLFDDYHRPDYKALSKLRQLFPNVPILALSATCPPNVLKDVLKILRLNRVTDFKRKPRL